MTRPESEKRMPRYVDARRRKGAIVEVIQSYGVEAETERFVPATDRDRALDALERLVEACETEPQLKAWHDALAEARSLLDSSAPKRREPHLTLTYQEQGASSKVSTHRMEDSSA